MDLLAWEVVLEALREYDDFENPSFGRALVYARKQVADLSEVRPVLSRNPYTGEVSESAWEASDAYSDDVWSASGV